MESDIEFLHQYAVCHSAETAINKEGGMQARFRRPGIVVRKQNISRGERVLSNEAVLEQGHELFLREVLDSAQGPQKWLSRNDIGPL